jgi:hypothetical protein
MKYCISACIAFMIIPAILAEIDVEFSFASSSSDPTPFNSAKLLEEMGSKNTTDSKAKFAYILNNESVRVVNASFVICVDGKCVDDVNVPPAVIEPNVSSTPRPLVYPISTPIVTTQSEISGSVIATACVAVGSISVLVAATVMFRRLSTSKAPASNSQINRNLVKKTSKLMQVEIDWPKKNPYQSKTGYKAREGCSVLPCQAEMVGSKACHYV